MVKPLNNYGDTIVEVMIAMAIVSLILGISYASANRSLNNIREAQEHTIALKVAESQIELLRTQALYTAPYKVGFLFCMDSSGAVRGDQINDSVGNPVPITTPGMPQTNSLNDNLNYGTCSVMNGVTYNYAIDRSLPPVVFTVHVRWDSIHRSGHNEVTLAYKTL